MPTGKKSGAKRASGHTAAQGGGGVTTAEDPNRDTTPGPNTQAPAPIGAKSSEGAPHGGDPTEGDPKPKGGGKGDAAAKAAQRALRAEGSERAGEMVFVTNVQVAREVEDKTSPTGFSRRVITIPAGTYVKDATDLQDVDDITEDELHSILDANPHAIEAASVEVAVHLHQTARAREMERERVQEDLATRMKGIREARGRATSSKGRSTLAEDEDED